MSSSKSVSKRGSTKSSPQNIKETTHLVVNGKDYSLSLKLFVFVVACAFNGSIFYYLYNLEDETCQCVRDWRHNFIKGMCILGFIISILSLFNIKDIDFKINKSLMIVGLLDLLTSILGLVNAYAIYTYVNDLQSTKCSCAIDNQPKLNKFMKGFSYFIYCMFVLFIILLILISMFYIYKKLK